MSLEVVSTGAFFLYKAPRYLTSLAFSDILL